MKGVSVGHESSQNKIKPTQKIISQLVDWFKKLKLGFECFANDFILQNESACRGQPREKTEKNMVKNKIGSLFKLTVLLSDLMAARFTRDPMTSKLVFEKKGNTIELNILLWKITRNRVHTERKNTADSANTLANTETRYFANLTFCIIRQQ